MGFGLVGAGAAVSGLLDGYQKGRKFAQDEERFELEKEEAADRKKLRAEQIKGIGLSNKKAEIEISDAEKDREIDDQVRSIWKDAEAEVTAQRQPPGIRTSVGSVLSPAAPGYNVPSENFPSAGQGYNLSSENFPPARAGGISTPGEAAAQDLPAQPRKSIFQIRQDAYTKALEVQATRRGANVPELMKQALEGARLFRNAETRERIGLLEAFRDGTMTQDQVFQEMERRGLQTMPGASLKVVDRPWFKDSKLTFPDVEISFADGRKPVYLDDMAEKTMDPDKVMDKRTKIGQLMITASHYGAMEGIARDEAKARGQRDDRNHAETMARINQQLQQNAELYKLNYEKFQWDKFIQSQGQAQTQLERLFGWAPLTEDVRLKLENQGNPGDPKKGIPSDLEKAEARVNAASRAVSGAMVIYGMNIDPKTLKPNATPAEVKESVSILIKSKEKPELIKRDELGRAYVDVGGNKVLVPAPEAPKAAPAAEPAPAAAPPAAAPGIAAQPAAAQPGNPYVDSRGKPTGIRVPGDDSSVLTSTVAPAVGRAAEATGRAAVAASAAASQYMSDAPKVYLQGKIARGESLSATEKLRAQQYGLLK